MGTFSTTAPTNVVGWSAEVTGECGSRAQYVKLYFKKNRKI